jgi:HEAT repeat protein/beta-lactamase regulating signal transducer with metallopeptidase domain
MMVLMLAQATLSANGNTWLEILLAASLKGLLILMIAAALSFALRKASAASRHLVWSLAIASLLALPLLSFGLPPWQVNVLPNVFSAGQSDTSTVAPPINRSNMQEPEPVAALNYSPPVAEGKPSTVLDKWPVTSGSYAGQASDLKTESPGWAGWALIAWLAGTALILARLLAGTVSVWWMTHRAQRIKDDVWVSLAQRLALRVGLTRQVALLKSNSVTMPLTCGVMRSSILLPADADDWPDERRNVVLLHELAHVKRRDCLTQMLAHVACAIYWFNPLTWTAARQLRMERERACDDQVLDAGTKASDYADHLLDIARRLRSAKCSSLAAVAIARRSQLEGRLLAILDPSVSRRGLSRIGSVAVGLVVACIILPLASLCPSAQTKPQTSQQAPLAIKSLSRSASEPAAKIAPAQPVPQMEAAEIEAAETIEVAPPELSEIESPAPQPAIIYPQPQPEQTPTSANQQEKDSAVAALIEALKDEDAEVREHALFALSQVGGPRAAEALIAALKDSNSQIREKAVWGLGIRHGEGQVDALIGALRDSNSRVREKAAWSLGLRGNQSSVEPLVNALRDEDAQVRERSAWALGLKGDHRAIEPLINALKDGASEVRGMAAWSLGMKGDHRALKALNAAMKDGNKDVRHKASWALGMLLVRNGESASNDDEFDVDVDVDADSDNDDEGTGSGSGTGSGVGNGRGSGKGSGKAKAKAIAKPE